MQTHDLSGFGCEDLQLAVSAAGCLLQYAKETQRAAMPHIRHIAVLQHEDCLLLDAVTRRHLELTTNLSGGHENTLVSVLDHTKTAMGSRLLKRWLNQPLRNRDILHDRQDAVCELLTQYSYIPLQKILHRVCDLERLLARIALKTARPRDLIALRETLALLPSLRQSLEVLASKTLMQLTQSIHTFSDCFDLLRRAIIDHPPPTIREGGVIAKGYDQELDELLAISEHAGDYLIQLEEQEKKRTGLSTLKVGYNRVHGYYIEISRLQAKTAPVDYIRRQTLKNTERFITPELKIFEDKALSAHDRALVREKMLYDALLDQLNPDLLALQACAAAIAEIDVLANFSERACQLNWSKPVLTDELGVHIIEGRHPVIETVSSKPFVPNDVILNHDERMLIITGPNMGGKSTYMRQTALIVLLSAIGSYVPARFASIGSIDRIFTRIGASDDLASGRSTFMVEMTETAHILNQATQHSLILMDEMGRGTSTFDGLSLAFACAYYLAKHIGALTLFATHYFELTALADEITVIRNIHLDVKEHEDTIIFLYHVLTGPANQSYGIEVAKLAGVPRAVIDLAKQKLKTLEQQVYHHVKQPDKKNIDVQMTEHPAIIKLREINPDHMTAKEALDVLYELHHMAIPQKNT